VRFFQTVNIALKDLALHKFRSFLAALGIIFGVASVEAMVSISEGAKTAALARIAALGVDNIIIRSQRPLETGRGGAAGAGGRNMASYGLLRRDLEHVRLTCQPRYAIGARNMRTRIYTPSGSVVDVTVIATEPDYLPLTRSQIQRGRFLSTADQAEHAQISVLGIQAARKIFGFEDPMDKVVRINGDHFRVVGILDNAAAVKDAGGDDINNQVFIPLATARALNGDISRLASSGQSEVTNIQLDTIALQLSDSDQILSVAARLQNYFEQTHKQTDYDFLIPLAQLRQKADTQRIFTVVMASIASVSLLIGGIGIMNIMLANVYDRRKEIGTRRALGARRADILYQFVLEAATLTTLGGMIGVAVGYGLARAVSLYSEWPTIISPVAIALGMAISSLVGILFGYWPARQAARTNPIEALRAN
jgi:putative ABC transport system permease protein